MKTWRLIVAAVVFLGAVPAAAWPHTWNLAVGAVSVRLGVRVIETTEQLREALGVGEDHGAFVLEAESDGPADRVGLRAGDVLTKIAGEKVGDAGDILSALEGHQPGEQIRMEYARDRATHAVTVTLARANGERTWMQPRWFGGSEFEWPGELGKEFRRFRDHVERQLKELNERLRQLERNSALQISRGARGRESPSHS